MKLKILYRPQQSLLFKKIISRGLIVGLLFNNIGYSFANIKNLDARYETFEGNNITIDNVLEEDTVDVEIEGNTLVNIINYDSLYYKNNRWDYDFDKRTGYIKLTDKTDSFVGLTFNVDKPIELNKEYTLFVNVTKNTMLRYDSTTNNRVVKIFVSENFGTENVHYINSLETGIIKYVFTPSGENLHLPRIETLPNAYNGEFEFKDFMIVEGNHMDKDISFFEEIKSVGQNKDTNNSFNLKNIPGNENLIVGSDFKVVATKDQEAEIKNIYLSPDIDLQSLIGEKLTLSFDVHTLGEGKDNPSKPIYGNESSRFGIHGTIYWSDTTGQKSDTVTYPLVLCSNHNINNKRVSISQTITPPVGYDKIKSFSFAFQTYRLPADNNDEEWYLSRPKLEYGDKVTAWIPNYNEDLYQKYVKTIDLNDPLRALDNTVKDRIIKKNGQWIIERNCGEFILDGSEEWRKSTVISWQKQVYYTYKTNSLVTNKNHFIHTKNDKVEDLSANALVNNNKYGIALWNLNSIPCIMIDIESISSIEELKEWLKDNPITVVYPLNKAIYEPLNINLTTNIYLDMTKISDNSIIPANIKIIVDRVANRAKEAIEVAKSNPTIENISQARYWSNLMRESILKDKFQNEINTNINIEDLTIEKKTTTSNMDVYIKSQNGLSMTLSTNSIIFDEFDSTEDMEKLNAVNLTVNSSLPYQLNSYMMTELKNKDNTEVIPRELFNIRLNGETDYKAFSNINEKLILKENCQKGNNNQFNIDLILKGSLANKADIYKTILKFEAEQK